ncbi:MAG: DUF4267 domain-containing protein [Pseudomonadota bacterium]
MRAIRILAAIIVTLLVAAGLAFVVAPEVGLAALDHTRQGLPYAFGGRYMGLALIVAVFAWLQDARALGVVALAGMLMSAIDAVTYVSLGEPIRVVLPHAAAFAVTSAVAWLCLSHAGQVRSAE